MKYISLKPYSINMQLFESIAYYIERVDILKIITSMIVFNYII